MWNNVASITLCKNIKYISYNIWEIYSTRSLNTLVTTKLNRLSTIWYIVYQATKFNTLITRWDAHIIAEHRLYYLRYRMHYIIPEHGIYEAGSSMYAGSKPT